MTDEIEDRFLVFNPPSLDAMCPLSIIQGYLSSSKEATVRVRKVDNDKGFITIKGKKVGNKAPEYEYPISVEDAVALLDMCDDVILTKNRYEIIGKDGMKWELDIFTGRHSGLTIAEIELPNSKAGYLKPGWLGPEITGDKRLSNESLARTEFKEIIELIGEYLPKDAGHLDPTHNRRL